MEKNTTRLSFDLKSDFHKKLKIFCTENNVTIKDFVLLAIKEALEEKKWTA